MFSRGFIPSSFVGILRLLTKASLLNWVSGLLQGRCLWLEKYLIFSHEGEKLGMLPFRYRMGWNGMGFPPPPFVPALGIQNKHGLIWFCRDQDVFKAEYHALS